MGKPIDQRVIQRLASDVKRWIEYCNESTPDDHIKTIVPDIQEIIDDAYKACEPKCQECMVPKEARYEPENAYCGPFWIFGCDCDDPDGYGYGPSPELAEKNYYTRKQWDAVPIPNDNNESLQEVLRNATADELMAMFQKAESDGDDIMCFLIQDEVNERKLKIQDPL